MVVPPLAADAEKQLQRAAHLDGDVARVAGMGRQRQAVGTGPDDGNIVRCSVHFLLHRGQCVKPAGVTGVGPGQALHGLHDAQVGKRGQNLRAGEKLLPPRILSLYRIFKRMHHQHPLAGQRCAPRVGVVVRLQRAQFGVAGGGAAAAHDLALGPHVPEGQQVSGVGTFDVGTAKFCQRGVIGREHAGQVADVLPRPFGKARAAVLQVVGGGAHLGRAAAGRHVGCTCRDSGGDGVVAILGRKDRQAAIFHCKTQAAVNVCRLLHQFVVVIHGGSP